MAALQGPELVHDAINGHAAQPVFPSNARAELIVRHDESRADSGGDCPFHRAGHELAWSNDVLATEPLLQLPMQVRAAPRIKRLRHDVMAVHSVVR